MAIQPSTLVSDELARQLETAHIEFTAQRVEGIARRPGNPYNAQVTRFGPCVALSANLPLRWMNTVHVLGEPELTVIAQIAHAYRAQERPLNLEILQADSHWRWEAELRKLGFVPITAKPTMASENSNWEDQVGNIETQIVTADNFEIFLDTFLAGFESTPLAKDNMRHWIEQPNWRLYLATTESIPAAAAVLSLHSEIGYLAAAATVPKYRGIGCQRTLIRQRLIDAREAGCRQFVARCDGNSVSQRNLKRQGLQLAYMTLVWVLEPQFQI